ncbi:16S rRNA (guanine(527)-N(7))-methyltransferase RsmG [Amphritea sp. 2_MG-2023]|jgi:16S rRNA (guanine527-N7)-methyltransferase|uniref:16S rRNA (guanine(527)-N(7))-methyltransferase RsmG n=1 Tax=Amphritea TaxID=515417 RepID=UPI001C07655D|nr:MULTISPECIES: 16S rRNA (guanine(527)-N(7))-methyltransferase RsmG [Amphritea]MBU2967677.1 16S rRNA (guanine(527)-N(7))-methyltransferase RsmG [Amphritea atlantica]MDO6417006.1 16S rRNA (guanine(527)-N(7))-methyltransferase RsmG [Amphritea sp. 2_MG-2023]MDX2422104.1 16S rRNA (guanine(527)-N(7))-methyltransferase RsmG [Amphritea sp.]
MPQYRDLLEQQCQQIDLQLSDEQYIQLLKYHALLVKWNKTFNLTAVRSPEEMISRHLIDSLSVLPYIDVERLIDVGSGPGLPGIPLAICRPDLPITLLDSNIKKSRFQFQAKAELGLDNVDVIHERVEKYTPDVLFDGVISRAFASLQDMLHWTTHLCANDGIFLAMKGMYPVEEIELLPESINLRQSVRLNVPGTEGERHLLMLGRT